jgi:type VI secretion system protein ImpI
MILKLEVLKDPGFREPTVIGERGGTIGRSESCDLCLPDGYVSNSHARITFRDGSFLIEDTSSNGICRNSPTNRLAKGQVYQLASGDLLLIDPYEIRVSIETGFEERAPIGDGALEDSAVLDPLNYLGGDSARRKPRGRRLEDLPPPELQNDPFRPPDVIPPAPQSKLIPDDWQDQTGSGAKSRSEPPPPPPPPPPAQATLDPTPFRQPRPGHVDDRPSRRAAGELSEVLKGAGLPPDLVTAELAQDFGRIIRIIVDGVMQVLKARQELKDSFRMSQTKIQSTGNNPLKFSANLDDALQRLFVRNRAYLEPVAAFQDAFDDLVNHQMAMLEGMRVAYEAMLKSFSPEVLQAEFDKQAKAGILSGPAKLRYWDQYKTRFDDIVRDADSFQNLFGEEFANAYDEQLDRLKASRRSAPLPDGPGSGRSRR